MKKRAPDYGFTNGLVVEKVARLTPGSYDAARSWQGGQFTTPNDKIQIATVEDVQRLTGEPYSKENVERTIEQLENPRYIRSKGRVGIELAIFGNPDADTMKVLFYGWGGNFRHPNAQREAIALAYSDPNVAYAVVNGPGVGNSGMLPKSVRKEISQTGSYLPLGEYTAPVVDKIAEDYDNVIVGGHSLGARTATGVVAHMDKGSVEEFRLHDPTGTRDMGLGSIAMRFGVGEGLANAAYEKALGMRSAKNLGLEMLPQNDPKKIESVQIDVPRGITSQDIEPGEFEAPKHGWVQQFLVDPAGLKRDAFESDLRAAIPNVEREIVIFVPDMSHLNYWRDVANIVGRMRTVEGVTAEINQWNIVGHTHANMDQPPSLATIYTAELS